MTMRLSDRFAAYYAISIAVILVGFSVALYQLASRHLYRQVDERLESAMDTLAAAAEVDDEGVTWELEERVLALGGGTYDGEFAWRVSDAIGARMDGFATSTVEDVLVAHFPGATLATAFTTVSDESGADWRVASRRLEAEPPTTRSVAAPTAESTKAIVLTVAMSLDGIESNLRILALSLTGLSILVWLLAFAAGRRFCRVVLRPLTDMANAAQAIRGDEPGDRLPAPKTDDELGELGSSFNALLDRLGESLERQQGFVGDAAHQLGTPLTAMQGHVDLALRVDRSAEEYRTALLLAQEKTRHLRRIVDALTFLSRADAEARSPSLERVELGEWLREYLADWNGPRCEGVVYEYAGGEACYANVHGPLLGELLNNLLDNAAKYSPPHSAIRVRLTRQDDTISFHVSNAGAGIAPADLPKLFDPFFRSESARIQGSPGLGLGLSIAARIAAAFGGTITVVSGPGEGATFSVSLPKVK